MKLYLNWYEPTDHSTHEHVAVYADVEIGDETYHCKYVFPGGIPVAELLAEAEQLVSLAKEKKIAELLAEEISES